MVHGLRSPVAPTDLLAAFDGDGKTLPASVPTTLGVVAAGAATPKSARPEQPGDLGELLYNQSGGNNA
jgi:hypothetical protein